MHNNNSYIGSHMTDYGPEPFTVNIEQATCRNNNFRTALWSEIGRAHV